LQHYRCAEINGRASALVEGKVVLDSLRSLCEHHLTVNFVHQVTDHSKLPPRPAGHFGFLKAFKRCLIQTRKAALLLLFLTARKFRRYTLSEKCFAIGALIFVFEIPFVLLAYRQLAPSSSLVLGIVLTGNFAFWTAGLFYELWSMVRKLWGTAIGKITFGLFSAFCAFIADQFGRHVVYTVTGENPDAFPSARTALIWIFTPFAFILGFYVFALVGILVSGIMSVTSIVWMHFRDLIETLLNAQLIRIVFGHRRQHFQQVSAKGIFHLAGFVGVALFSALALQGLAVLQDRAKWIIEQVVVYTGFTPVPPDRYTTVKRNSGVNFLPADRVCIAEPLPNGKFSFRTVQRNDLK